MPSSTGISGLLCPDSTRQYEAPIACVMSIHRFCFSISVKRNCLSLCVKSGEQHIIGITLPVSSTCFLKFTQLPSFCISKKPAYHSRPSISNADASCIHLESCILPSLQSACINAFGKAANRGIFLIFLQWKLLMHLL